MHRFFFTKKETDHFLLNQEQKQHLKVLRVQKESIIAIYENKAYLCKVDKERAWILKSFSFNHENNFATIAFVPLIKQKRLEWLFEKGTELGISHFYLFKSQFSSSTYRLTEARLVRFQKIILAAAQQAYRNVVPQIVLHNGQPWQFSLIIEKYQSYPFLVALSKKRLEPYEPQFYNSPAVLVVGPEGGFSEAEISLMQSKSKVHFLSLGKTILRTETSLIKLLALVKN